MARKIEAPHIKYVFVDVVGFAKGRSVEAQADIIRSLNEITVAALKHFKIEAKSRILLPSGDGLCVAMIQPRTYDIHLEFALELLRRLDAANSETKDERRKYSIRIGINENTDNIILDVNGRRNVAGAGINLAQRVMDFADEGQVLVYQSVHDVLVGREKFANAFRKYSVEDKHKQPFALYQYILPSSGLRIEPPRRLAPIGTESKPKMLTGYLAYFIGHAFQNQDFLKQIVREGSTEYAAIVGLHFLALDSIERRRSSKFESPILKAFGDGKAPFQDVFLHYSNQDWWMTADFVAEIVKARLSDFRSCFEAGSLGPIWIIPSTVGINRVKTAHPDWWARVVAGDPP